MLSNLICPRCHYHLTKQDEDAILYRWYSVDCKSCDLHMDAYMNVPDVVLDRSCYSLKSVGTAKANTWWHYTSSSENWLNEVIDAGVWVHIGTKESALAMKRIRYITDAQVETRMFRLKIDPSIIMSHVIYRDDNSWPVDLWDTEMVDQPRIGRGVSAIRYVNKYESPGQISLMIDPRFLLTVSQEVYPPTGESNRT